MFGSADTTFEFWEYNTTGTCTGPTDYYYSGALNSCQENVFDDEDDITSVQYGLGWIKYTYSSSTPSSPRPSFQPTHMSTSAPTVQTSPIVTFTSNVTLENLTSQTLDQVSINAILSAQASSMIIPVSAVSFITFSGSLAAATEEQTATSSRHTSLRSFAGKMKVMAGFNMVVTTRSTIALSATTYASTADLYESLTSNLVTAVNDDVYGAYLRASGVPELASAGASDASSSAPIIFYPASGSDSSSGGDQLSTGAIVGIVIGVVAFVVICAAAFYFLVIDGGAVMGTAKRTSPGQSTAPAINFPGGAGGDQAFVTNPVQINKSPMH